MTMIQFAAAVMLATAGATIVIAALTELAKCVRAGQPGAGEYLILSGCGAGIFLCGAMIVSAS